MAQTGTEKKKQQKMQQITLKYSPYGYTNTLLHDKGRICIFQYGPEVWSIREQEGSRAAEMRFLRSNYRR
jgi:hypothetical protein